MSIARLLAITVWLHLSMSIGWAQARLNLEQVHVLRELLKEARVEPVIVTQQLNAGDPPPTGVALVEMPPSIGEKIPAIKSHFLIVSDQQILLVDPQREKITEIFDR